MAGLTARGTDFGLLGERPVGEVLDHWRHFRQQMRWGFQSVVVAHQCHGTRVVIHEAPAADWHVLDDADGHLSARPGILLSVTVADCVPVYLAHGESGCVGLLHAGWRGLAGGIVECGLQLFCQLASCPVSDVIIHCGVGICGECYEVGPEVWQAVTGEPVNGKQRLDLRAQLVRRVGRLGARRVTQSPWCSAHDADAFYSHRRSAGADGRMLAYIGQPLA